MRIGAVLGLIAVGAILRFAIAISGAERLLELDELSVF